MIRKKYLYLYGPVASWRLGSSLGIDPLSKPFKICTFDCRYCQLGKTKALCRTRDVFVSVFDLAQEIKALPPVRIDYVTFSGTGEPTLAANIGWMIEKVKKMRREKVAVITNASLLSDGEVREDLRQADKILVKLDAADEKTFQNINRPAPGITLKGVVEGIRKLRGEFAGEIAVQSMFIAQNRAAAREIAALAKTFSPDEVQINTPLRPCAVKPLAEQKMAAIKDIFRGEFAGTRTAVVSIYDEREPAETESVSAADTIRRRGKPV